MLFTGSESMPTLRDVFARGEYTGQSAASCMLHALPHAQHVCHAAFCCTCLLHHCHTELFCTILSKSYMHCPILMVCIASNTNPPSPPPAHPQITHHMQCDTWTQGAPRSWMRPIKKLSALSLRRDHPAIGTSDAIPVGRPESGNGLCWRCGPLQYGPGPCICMCTCLGWGRLP